VLIPQDAADRFIQLYLKLMYYAGCERGVLPASMSPDEFMDTSMAMKGRCRDAIYEPSPMFEQFLQANGSGLSDEERALVSMWARHHVRGMLVILMHRKEHTVFLDTQLPARAYGALGLTSELSKMFPSQHLPVLVETVLLPYEGVVVCDGLVALHSIMIGPNMTRDMKDQYRDLKKEGQVITTADQLISVTGGSGGSTCT
jgi:hypothetical protein